MAGGFFYGKIQGRFDGKTFVFDGQHLLLELISAAHGAYGFCIRKEQHIVVHIAQALTVLASAAWGIE